MRAKRGRFLSKQNTTNLTTEWSFIYSGDPDTNASRVRKFLEQQFLFSHLWRCRRVRSVIWHYLDDEAFSRCENEDRRWRTSLLCSRLYRGPGSPRSATAREMGRRCTATVHSKRSKRRIEPGNIYIESVLGKISGGKLAGRLSMSSACRNWKLSIQFARSWFLTKRRFCHSCRMGID